MVDRWRHKLAGFPVAKSDPAIRKARRTATQGHSAYANKVLVLRGISRRMPEVVRSSRAICPGCLREGSGSRNPDTAHWFHRQCVAYKRQHYDDVKSFFPSAHHSALACFSSLTFSRTLPGLLVAMVAPLALNGSSARRTMRSQFGHGEFSVSETVCAIMVTLPQACFTGFDAVQPEPSTRVQ